MHSETLSIVKNIARKAGGILLKYKNEKLDIETKLDKFDLVTKADKESDDFIYKQLKHYFPSDKVLIEESKNSLDDYSGRVWMADPLDGTKHYLAGSNEFSVMIGLCIEGAPHLGVVYAPALNTFYWAEKDQGAYAQLGDGSPVRLNVSKVDTIENSTIVVRYRRGEYRLEDSFIENLPVKEKIPGSSVGIKLGLVAEGKADAVFSLNNRARKWDYCAPEIILNEAGGVLTDLENQEVNYLIPDQNFEPMTLASNKLVHSDMLEAFRDWRASQ
jgi:3'(2'), 5'-bisphosphate nucleotidase